MAHECDPISSHIYVGLPYGHTSKLKKNMGAADVVMFFVLTIQWITIWLFVTVRHGKIHHFEER